MGINKIIRRCHTVLWLTLITASLLSFLIIFLALPIEHVWAYSSDNVKTSQLLEVVVGAERFDKYFPLLKGKRVALVVNQTSCIGPKSQHLLDVLLGKKIKIVKIFVPEHGFRGNMDANEEVPNCIDEKTGIHIVSLHGKKKCFKENALVDVDIVVFDIQDVGVRFYTYISVLHLTMEACASAKIPLIVFDRPNPNGSYIDGPVLEMECSSYLGKHPIPLVYGLTIGELAMMINGEKWLKGGVECNLKVIKLKNYTHETKYKLPINPSPNLVNAKSIELYPTLGLFEATSISVGRGTDFPLQVLGYPNNQCGDFTFTPKSMPGKASSPKYENIICYGVDLRNVSSTNYVNLEYLIKFYKLLSGLGEKFFEATFDIHAGNKLLRKQIESGLSEKEIRESWQDGIASYKLKRKKYLIYE